MKQKILAAVCALALCAAHGLRCEPLETSYFLGRETLVQRRGSGLVWWRQMLFVVLFRNASSAASWFRLPANRVVELGTQVEL